MRRPARGGGEVGVREIARRTRETNRWIGRQVAGARLEAGVSQAQLARCAGIAPSYIWSIEAGLANPSVNVLTAVSACLGCDLGIRLFPTSGPRLHDRFQAPMVEALIKLASNAWEAEPEVPVAAARGVIDLILRRRADRTVIVCECHSELRRLELAIRRLGEKADVVAGLEPEAAVSRLLLVRSTEGTRAVARTYERTLVSAFPGRTADAIAGLRSADGLWPGPTLLWAALEGGKATILESPPRGVRIGR